MFRNILQSPEIGLKPCPHDPCVYHGTPTPGKLLLYLAIYVDDLIFFFSVDDKVELYFQTHPDLATIYSRLATCMHPPSPGHLEALKYVGKYILSTIDLGLMFTKTYIVTLKSYIHFPLGAEPPSHLAPTLATFCDATWGLQDASHPSHTNIHPITIQESKFIFGHIFFYGGCSILWKTHKESHIS
jgi:hypothetical protein